MNPPITRQQYMDLRARLEGQEQEYVGQRKHLDETEPMNTSAWKYLSGKIAGVASAINVLEGFFYNELPAIPTYRVSASFAKVESVEECPRWQHEAINFLDDPITRQSGCGDEFLPGMRSRHQDRCGLCGRGQETAPVALNLYA